MHELLQHGAIVASPCNKKVCCYISLKSLPFESAVSSVTADDNNLSAGFVLGLLGTLCIRDFHRMWPHRTL